MVTSLILLGSLLVVCAIILAMWPLGRVIALESLLHPLRRSVIQNRPDGSVVVKLEDTKNLGHNTWQNPEGGQREGRGQAQPPLAQAGTVSARHLS